MATTTYCWPGCLSYSSCLRNNEGNLYQDFLKVLIAWLRSSNSSLPFSATIWLISRHAETPKLLFFNCHVLVFCQFVSEQTQLSQERDGHQEWCTGRSGSLCPTVGKRTVARHWHGSELLEQPKRIVNFPPRENCPAVYFNLHVCIAKFHRKIYERKDQSKYTSYMLTSSIYRPAEKK